MKTLTYILKYHFIKISCLLIGLMWQGNVFAQNEKELPECLIIDEQTPNEANNQGAQWMTQSACVLDLPGTGGDAEPYDYQPVSWEGGEENCGHEDPQGNGGQGEIIPGFDISVGAYEVIASDPNEYDPYVFRQGEPSANIIQMMPPSGNPHFLRIGDRVGGFHAHRIIGTFEIDPEKPILKYSYAVAMQDTESNIEHGEDYLFNPDGSVATGKPYFTIRFRSLENKGEELTCGSYSVVGVATANANLDTDGIRIRQDVEGHEHNGMVINWTENILDLSQYEGKVEVEITVTECNQGGHTGWAYIDFACEEGTFEVNKEGDGCTYNFSTEYTGNYIGNYGEGNVKYLWDFGDGTTSTDANPYHTYSESGDYEVTLEIEYCHFPNGNGGCASCEEDACTDSTCEFNCNPDEDNINETIRERCSVTFTQNVNICCDFCASDFAPLPGSEYVISAWVKESDMPSARTYDSPNITLYFEGPDTETDAFVTSGAIIDGWQRIEAEFDVPGDAEKIKIQLNNSGNNDVFFDDVRIHPFDASMKSFVYDPVTLRLSAELDERNYATYYEYDEEGALIRIKKETERGVMTIQEARNGIRKQ